MWFPCNIGDKAMISKLGDGNYEEYTFIGVNRGCFNLYDYVFRNERGSIEVLENEDKYGYSHRDVKTINILSRAALIRLK